MGLDSEHAYGWFTIRSGFCQSYNGLPVGSLSGLLCRTLIHPGMYWIVSVPMDGLPYSQDSNPPGHALDSEHTYGTPIHLDTYLIVNIPMDGLPYGWVLLELQWVTCWITIGSAMQDSNPPGH
eukprot:15358526-Ditylum_brightwellii.AAC.1